MAIPGLMALKKTDDHIRDKEMWAGPSERVEIPELQGLFEIPDVPNTEPFVDRYELRKIDAPHTPALFKIWDESIVNATDHKKACEGYSKSLRVQNIDITFDGNKFAIHNDGEGIPIFEHEEASEEAGRVVYNPEVAFSRPFSGTNMDKPDNCVKGGTNGLGAKIVNLYSNVFNVTTCDGSRIYAQTWKNRKKTTLPAEITDKSRKTSDLDFSQRTVVSFVPAYAELGYGDDRQADVKDFEAWIRLRLCQSAAYVGETVSVTYNGERIPITSSADLFGIISKGSTPVSIKWIAGSNSWDVAFDVSAKRKKFEHFSVVNGVATVRGTHVNHIRKTIADKVKTKLKSMSKDKTKTVNLLDAMSCVSMVFSGSVPGARWTGQRKDEVQIADKILKEFALGRGNAAAMNGLVETIAVVILSRKRKGGKAANIKKYTRAETIGNNSYLLVAEGDSAMGFLRIGLGGRPDSSAPDKKAPAKRTRKRAAPKARGCGAASAASSGESSTSDLPFPSFDRYGMISLQGVVMNALKNVTEIDGDNGKILVSTEKLKDHERFVALCQALGLDFDSAYETADEMDALNYGGLIICVDQDLDGCGKIQPLFLAYIYKFWPNLVRNGFVRRFITPVVRLFPKGEPPVEFIYEEEAKEWLDERGVYDDDVFKLFHPKYYKGLASHKPPEIREMFQTFRDRVYTVTTREADEALFQVFFGKETAARKEILRAGLMFPARSYIEELKKNRVYPVSDILNLETVAYKLDDIQRKIPHCVDGLNKSRRKILAGGIQAFKTSAKSKKVFQFGGYVADKMAYHHGDASLNGTIINMAYRGPGGKLFPYFIGEGVLGTRRGDDAGSPRYIAVRLASPFVEAMLPRDDKYILEYNFDDGERVEPVHYVPVLPMVLLEYLKIPAEGWNHLSFARNAVFLAEIVLLMFSAKPGDDLPERLRDLADTVAEDGDNALALVEEMEEELCERFGRSDALPIAADNFAGDIRRVRGVDYSVGKCAYSEKTNSLVVDELPMWVTVQKFVDSLEPWCENQKETKKAAKKPPKKDREVYIRSISDFSGETNVDVHIELMPGAWEAINAKYSTPEFDGIFNLIKNLKKTITPKLNYVSATGGVMEFNRSYLAALMYWFPFRRDMYKKRLERRIIILDAQIKLEEEICRYVELSRAGKIRVSAIEDEEKAARELERLGFLKIDKGFVNSPKYAPVDTIERRAFGTDLARVNSRASYDYLLDLTERETLTSSYNRRLAKLGKLRAEQAECLEKMGEKPFPGVSIWATDIVRVMKVIELGNRTAWEFETGLDA